MEVAKFGLMGDRYLTGKQRVSLIFWHAQSCPDGTTRSGKPWKKELAELVGISPSLVTKLTKVGPQSGELGIKRETLNKLGHASDEAFLAVLGFQSKSKTTDVNASQPNHAWVKSFSQASDMDEYVDLCIENGVKVHVPLEEAAKGRVELRKQSQREATARWRADDEAYWFQPYHQSASQETVGVPMHHSEIEAIQNVHRKLTSPNDTAKTTVVYALPFSGLAYALQRLLPSCNGFGSHYRGGIHHLHIGALEYPNQARTKLAKNLIVKLEHEDESFRQWSIEKKIAKQLNTQDQLLIIHGASAIPEEALPFIRKLSDELADAPQIAVRQRVCRLVLTSWEPGAFNYINNKRFIKVDYLPEISADEALAYFRESLDHYRIIRGKAAHSTIGPRAENAILKRADHHYRSKNTAFTETPSAVRFRAFCASDTTNVSPFDPTQGVWQRIESEWRQSVPEISDCFSDIQSDLRIYSNKHATDDLLALRAVSTGLFFLTSDMLKKLKDNQLSRNLLGSANITYHLQSKYVHFQPDESDEDSGRYTAPLLVRAIVQDDWMRFEPTSRAKIHEAIGETLREMILAEGPADPRREIPYQYPWDDSGVVLALEAIRHFVRAAKSAAHSNAVNLTRKALQTYDEFLEEGTFSASDSDASRQMAGILSRSHGLQALKYEALCLLSQDGAGIQAPLGTGDREQLAFFRELGITLSRMLRPHDALTSFESCLALDCLSSLDRSYVLAHAVSACILCGNLSQAKSYLRQAREIEAEVSDHELLRKIKSRNDARTAMLALASGRRQESRTLWAEIADEGIAPFQGDRAISYFDSLLASPITLIRQRALADAMWANIEHASHVALENMFDHERLRIDIRKASLARLLGFPRAAEAMLEHVGLDIAKHSGAEILFREFQLESAETLRALRRPRYAFVAYAWPAFQSLRRRSVEPLLRKSRVLCARLLGSMSELPIEASPSIESNRFWGAISRTSDGDHYPLFSVDLLPAGEDVERYFNELAEPEVRYSYFAPLRE